MTYKEIDIRLVIRYVVWEAMGLVGTVADITANDTNVGVAHWPLSLLESAVYHTCQAINDDLIHHFPIDSGTFSAQSNWAAFGSAVCGHSSDTNGRKRVAAQHSP